MDDPEYIRRAEDPANWQRDARHMICAANTVLYSYARLPWLGFGDKRVSKASVLRSRHSYEGVPILLLAFAVENVLKAIRVAKGQKPIANGKLAGDFKVHSLIHHANRAGLKSSTKTKWLYGKLQDFIESGKYPIGTTAEKGWGARGFSVSTLVPQTWRLLSRLEKELVLVAGTSVQQRINLRRLCVPGKDSVLR